MPFGLVALFAVASLVAAIWAATGTPRALILLCVGLIITDVALVLTVYGGGAIR